MPFLSNRASLFFTNLATGLASPTWTYIYPLGHERGFVRKERVHFKRCHTQTQYVDLLVTIFADTLLPEHARAYHIENCASSTWKRQGQYGRENRAMCTMSNAASRSGRIRQLGDRLLAGYVTWTVEYSHLSQFPQFVQIRRKLVIVGDGMHPSHRPSHLSVTNYAFFVYLTSSFTPTLQPLQAPAVKHHSCVVSH